MNIDVNVVWQSLRGAAEAGCLPSANMNSEGTCKQVPTLRNQHLLFPGPFLATLALCSWKGGLAMAQIPHFHWPLGKCYSPTVRFDTNEKLIVCQPIEKFICTSGALQYFRNFCFLLFYSGTEKNNSELLVGKL